MSNICKKCNGEGYTHFHQCGDDLCECSIVETECYKCNGTGSIKEEDNE